MRDVSCLFDTGASSTFMSETTLNDLGYKLSDSVGTSSARLADGRRVETTLINIPRINVLGKDFAGVKVSTLKGSKGASILGMDIISCMNVDIDNNTQQTVISIEMLDNLPVKPDNIQGSYMFNRSQNI